MPRRALIAAIAAILLVVGVGVPALAVTTQSWEERRIATEAFDAAAQSALDAAADSVAARDALAEARDGATPLLEDARAVASAAVGYFAEPLVTAVQSRASELETALSAPAPEGSPIPDTERPEAVADLTAAVEPLGAWAADEADRAKQISTYANVIVEAAISTADAMDAVVETVTGEAASAVAAAPLATPESRAAVETARDAVVDAVTDDSVLGKPVGTYTAAVAALRASQQAAVDAAAVAAAAAEESESPSVRIPFDFVWPVCIYFGPNDFVCT